MRILITGSTGLLGQALVRRLSASHEVIGLSRRAGDSQAGGRHVAWDLTDADAAGRAVAEAAPELVVHAQAMSDVDRCELEPDEARRQNVEAVDRLLSALRRRRPWFVFVSSDYVFDGLKGSPYDEQDEPGPVSVYGATKLEAERLALGYPLSTIVRPSTIFGPGRKNFCDQIVELAGQGREIEAFHDQTTSPTYSQDLAEGIEGVIGALRGPRAGRLPRILHITSAGRCRRVEFAHRVLQCLGMPEGLVKPIAMAEQHRPAKRPPYSALTSRHLSAVIGRELRSWEDALHAYLRHHHRSAFVRERSPTR